MFHVVDALGGTCRSVSRRQVLRVAGMDVLALATSHWLLGSAAPAKDRRAADPVRPLNRLPAMLQASFTRQVRRAERAGLTAKAALRTPADAQRYVEAVRAKIRVCFGPLPERTPLAARVTGVIERDAYRIEKVIFHSRPGFPVTANLYVPKGRKFPRPGVVGSCGHSANGKAHDVYQSFSQGLARLGYVVLIFDPIGQGERLQYVDGNLHSRAGAGVGEHLLAGNQQFLVGEFFGTWRAWDGIRALDYLLTRAEVDPRRIGITGCSGGGTMTTWLCGLDPRWSMAAPCCFVTTFRRNLENELPADTEQCPPRALALELDHDDFLAAMAPKPIILLAEEKDFFDVRGTAEAFARLQRLYRLLGREENIALVVGPGYHDYSRHSREAMYGWFNRATGAPAEASEPKLVIEPDQTLWCTPHGQVAELPARTVFSFTREKSQRLTKSRPSLDGETLCRAVANLLKLPPCRGVPDYRILPQLPPRRYPKQHCCTYAVETEPGIQAVVTMLCDEPHGSRPPPGRRRAVLYVAHQSSDAELRNDPWIAELLKAEPGAAFFACDVRGSGESQPNTCGEGKFRDPYGSDYFYAIHSIMLDRPYVGQRTHDVLRVLDWLGSFGHTQVHLAAKGWGTLPATWAAMLSAAVVRVSLKGALSSYSQIAEAEFYDWPLSSFLPGVLQVFDLPDCYRALAAKKLRLLEPRGAKG